MDESTLNFAPKGESSDSSSITSEHWRVFMDKGDNFQQMQVEKKAKCDEEFETFVDHSPSRCTDLFQ